MNRQPFQTPPQWWPPKLNRRWIRVWRPLRKLKQLNEQRLLDVEVSGLERLRDALASGHGVLITPNHSSHADAYALYAAADKLGAPFYFMTAWQVLGMAGLIKRAALRHHGCFSVDREGTDLRAFRQAVDILQSRPEPLVIFPEGEVYHVNDRVMPFRAGPASMALSAAKKADRTVVCVPCGMKYYYVDDPTPQLDRLMDDLESEIFWRPRPDLPLAERIYRFAEGALALKELEYLGHTNSGPIRARVTMLVETILAQLEGRYGVEPAGTTTPERIKTLRQAAIKRRESHADDDAQRRQCEHDLDDLFLAIQLFSYPGDYVRERPSIERMAETLDKFEEDVLGVSTATVRAARKAVVTFGEPIAVDTDRGRKGAVATLTRTLEERVQSLLDSMREHPQRAGLAEPVAKS